MLTENGFLSMIRILGVLAIGHAIMATCMLFYFSDKQRMGVFVFGFWFVWPFILGLYPGRSRIGFWVPVIISLIIMFPILVFAGFLLLSLGGHQ